MKRTESPRGLMAFWSDIAPENAARYREWHNCEHMPERVGIEGFVLGRRYVGIGKAPGFLMTYETRDASVFSGRPYLDALDVPTAWTREALAWFLNPVRNVYRLVHDVGKSTLAEAPYVLTDSFDLDDSTRSEALAAQVRWMDDEAIGLGARRARLYELDVPGSTVVTAERDIHSAARGDQRYLLFIEVGCADVDAGSALRTSLAPAESSKQTGGRRVNERLDAYWIDYAIAS